MDYRAIESFIPILIPLGAFALTAVLVGMDQLAKHRARELRHQTIRLLVEKGQPIPPDLLAEPAKKPAARGAASDLGRGVKLLFTGVGLAVCLYAVGQRWWPSGLLVAIIGLGYLVSHLVTPRQAEPPPAAQ